MIQQVSTMYGGVGMFGLILATVGLAGVTTHAVTRRRKEMGVRIARARGPVRCCGSSSAKALSSSRSGALPSGY